MSNRKIGMPAAVLLPVFIILILVFALFPTARPVSAAFLSFVEFQKDGVNGVDGLDGTFSVTVSPDGSHVYAASRFDSAVAVFSRNPLTGGLSFVEAKKNGVDGVGGLGGATSVVVSPDGAHVYAAGLNDDSIAVFSRNPATGALTFIEAKKDGVGGVDGLNGAISVTISPDGKNVYATGFEESAVAVFSRNTSSGALSFVAVYRDNISGADGIQQPIFITVSPDNKHVYVGGVSANDGVAVYSRDQTSGALSFVALYTGGSGGVDGLSGGQSIAFSADGLFAYVASSTSLIVFSRDAVTGRLTYIETFREGFDGVDGLLGAVSVAVSPDGTTVYVASQSDSAVAVFSRNPVTGRLTFVEVQKDGVGGVDGLDIAQAVAVSPDSKHIYTGSQLDDAVAVFSTSGTPAATASPTTTATLSQTNTPTLTATPAGVYLPLVIKQNPPTPTPTPTPTMTATPIATPTPTSQPGSSTTLYLCYDDQRNPKEFLSPQPCTWDNVQLFVYAGTSLDTRNFEFPLSSDIAGTSYTFEVLLASQGTTSFVVSAIVRQNGVETTLASTTFTAQSTTFEPFTATVPGTDPATGNGDVVIVRIRSISGSDAAILITQSHQTFLKIE